MHPVKTAVDDGVGSVVLDRPAALNALDPEMVEGMHAALRAWHDDAAVRAVVVSSAAPKAFCAGGDIRAIREAALRGDTAAVHRYFAAEYALDAAVAEFPKPYVSLIDGYALGGGLGISVHGRFRVATERAWLAMPETAIGFFPDVAASHFLTRLAGGVGMFLGLTGVRISGAAAVECGLATHFVDSRELPALERALAQDGGQDVAGVLADCSCAPPPSELHGHYSTIDWCFSAPRLDDVLARLEGEHTEWAEEILTVLRGASPSSLWLTFELLRRSAGLSLAECLARDLHLAQQVTTSHDFAEGVRAALVDKDRTPAWYPGSLADLTPDHCLRLSDWLDG